MPRSPVPSDQQLLTAIQHCETQIEAAQTRIHALHQQAEDQTDALHRLSCVKDAFDKRMNDQISAAQNLIATMPHKILQGLTAHIESICTGPRRRQAEDGFTQREHILRRALIATEDSIIAEKKKLSDQEAQLEKLQQQLHKNPERTPEHKTTEQTGGAAQCQTPKTSSSTKTK